MAEMQPVGLGIIPPNPQQGLGLMSSILGIQQQRQALQTGQYQQASAQAESQQAQQKNAELQALSQFTQNAIKDPNYLLEDGSLDTQKFQQGASAVAPVYGSPVIGQLTSNAKESVTTRKAVQDLSSEQNAQLGNALIGIATKKDATLSDVYDIAAQQSANNKNPDFNRALDNMLMHFDKNNIQGSAQMALTALKGIGNVSPSMVDTGGSIQPGSTNPFTGEYTPAGKPIVKTLAPQMVAYPSGQVEQVGGGAGTPSASGAKAPPAGPRTAAQDAPDRNAPKQVQDAYGQAVAQSNDHVEKIRQADNPLDYGNNMQIADQIRKLSKSTDTGPGTDTWHHVLGALGAPVGANNVADYQLLGAYLDRQAAGIRGAMGLPATNEGGVQSREIAGNTGYQGKALQDKNDLTQALTEGLHQYREGLDRVAGFSGQASPKAVNEFKSAWTKNFDPNVYKAELAYKRGPEEAKAFIKTLSPQEAASLTAKRIALKALSSGQVP